MTLARALSLSGRRQVEARGQVQNLRDKLLKAGLVTAEQAEKAAAEPVRKPAAKRGPRPEAPGSPEGRTGTPGNGPWITARLKPLGPVPKLSPLAGSKA